MLIVRELSAKYSHISREYRLFWGTEISNGEFPKKTFQALHLLWSSLVLFLHRLVFVCIPDSTVLMLDRQADRRTERLRQTDRRTDG